MVYKILRVDAFTNIVGQGNPAGVVLESDGYSSELMQKIAKAVGFNETVFVCKSDAADIKLRYFTPGHETPLCGHATIGAIFALYNNKGNHNINIETSAGILPVHYDDQTKMITMKQAAPTFVDFKGDKAALSKSLGIALEDLHPNWPIKYGNTGSWTLLVPVVKPSVLDRMQSNQVEFPSVLKELPKASIHPFAMLSKSEGTFAARHFSSPFSGTTEDSVTGTASGVMGAYALDHIYLETDTRELIMFQGRHVQKEGLVQVYVKRNYKGHCEVKISGTACLNEWINIENFN